MEDTTNQPSESVVNHGKESTTVKIDLHENIQFEIFISYRTDPDQGLATALKELLEGAIEPKPKVFVASAGGVRPSKIGYRPQIQAAANSSKAFIAIITQQSKDREWLFYEAGAAWGRNQIFAPLLINATPSDLASVIADYQSVKASDKDSMELLVTSIAEAIEGNIKTYFSRRHKTFLKKVETHRQIEEIDNVEDQKTPLNKAISLLEDDEIDEAEQLFEKLLLESTDDEEKARVKVAKIIHDPQIDFQKSEASRVSHLETLLSDFGDTFNLNIWLGLFETRSTSAIFYYEKALKIAEAQGIHDFLKNIATIQLAVEKFKVGDKDFAFGILLESLSSKDREGACHFLQRKMRMENH